MNQRWICVVDDDESVCDSLAQMFELRGYRTRIFRRGEALLASPHLHEASCLLVDMRMPGMSGLELLDRLAEREVRGPAIIVTGHGDIATAVAAMKKGAYDFLEKPFEKEMVLASVARAAEKFALVEERESLRRQLDAAGADQPQNYGIVGNSQAIRAVVESIRDYGTPPSSVLITGETGTGKELVARGLHAVSGRKGSFVAVNVATLSESLIHSELFGHEKGAFTGAVASHKGKFEYADQGTLLLDEIDSLPLPSQALLLRVIEEKQLTRLGRNEPVKFDTRILASTNRDLRALVDEGLFRRDLFHRLDILSIHVPPLRERREDIPLLASHFVREYCRFYEREPMDLDPAVLREMQGYEWPGNIRELKNAVEGMVLRSQEAIREWRRPNRQAPESTRSLRAMVDEFERQALSEALREVRGNLKSAAAALEIAPRTLFEKMRKLGLRKEDFR